VEIALNPALLIAGQIEPTQVRLAGARLWCPASVARGGARRPLIDTLTLDVTKEGRWLNLRSIQARGGKITCHLSGEIPTGLLRGEKDTLGQAPLSRRLADAFAAIETAIDVAERSGGASMSLHCQGRSDGSAELAVSAVLGNDWADGGLGLERSGWLNEDLGRHGVTQRRVRRIRGEECLGFCGRQGQHEPCALNTRQCQQAGTDEGKSRARLEDVESGRGIAIRVRGNVSPGGVCRSVHGGAPAGGPAPR
jgi:hypothetical protein